MRGNFHKRRIEGRLLMSKLQEGSLPEAQPAFGAIFFAGQLRRALEDWRRDFFVPDFLPEQSGKTLPEALRQMRQLNTSLVEEASPRSALGGACDLAAVQYEIMADWVCETRLRNFRRGL
jgi:hypothetical protein